MGVSSSKQPAGSKALDLGDVMVSFVEAPTSSLWNAEPRIILANTSDYIVSYWVVEEEKKRTKAQHERMATSIALHLNVNNITNKTKLSERDRKLREAEEEEGGRVLAKEEDYDAAYFLTRDHRMGRKGTTQPTRVPFPADCQHLRIYGFFERDGEWQVYKDKVYSIALRNKTFHVTATTPNIITPHSRRKTIGATKRR